MQLLIDEAYEMGTEVIEEINESSGAKQKNYYIHGTFSTPDKKNRNGRVYSTQLWVENVEKYQQHIKENSRNTLGELEHPTRVDVDPMKAVMKIVSLRMEEGVVKGRAKILNDNSPETNKLKALIDEGYKIGVSSRGTGRMKGAIVEEFQLSTYDVVQSPSDYNAMLSGLSESIEGHVSMNESTGKYVCDGEKCYIDESSSCSKNAVSLIESFKEYTTTVAVQTESEKLAEMMLEKTKKAAFIDSLATATKAFDAFIKIVKTIDKDVAKTLDVIYKKKFEVLAKEFSINIIESEDLDEAKIFEGGFFEYGDIEFYNKNVKTIMKTITKGNSSKDSGSVKAGLTELREMSDNMTEQLNDYISIYGNRR